MRRDHCAVVGGLRDGTEASGSTSSRDQLGHSQRRECGHPVDRLGHSGRLVEIEFAGPADETGGGSISGAPPRAPCGARSRRPAPARDSRSSGRGIAGAARRAGRGCGSRSAPRRRARPVNVPSSGTVTAASPRNSNSNASNSSSARSISSISSTGGVGPGIARTAGSGRSSRNSSVNRSASVRAARPAIRPAGWRATAAGSSTRRGLRPR